MGQERQLWSRPTIWLPPRPALSSVPGSGRQRGAGQRGGRAARLIRSIEAFLFSEKLRARSYLDLLSRALPPIRNPAQRQAESELRARIRRLQRAIEEETAKPRQRRQALDLFSTELAAAERTYQNLLDDLRRADPQYATARALTVPSAAEVQQRLAPDTALLEYVLAEDSVAVFALTARHLWAATVPVRAVDLEAKVGLLRDLILRTRSSDWEKPAASLRRALVEPVEQAGWLEGIQRLYLVPHGVLHYLPFAALARHSAQGNRFLMEDYVVAYLPSAAALVNGVRAGDADQTLFALAPTRARLQYAQQEAQSITAFFAPAHLVLLGRQATEGSFKRLAGRYQVVHLATHGYFNKLNPLLSGVELEPSPQEDGRLEVYEILDMRLKARLVTLSACDTALASGYFADVPAGDDFVGLTRAFLFAGSPSVLASLWEVNDRSTLRLMRSFYRHLGRSGKAAALALAQRNMRGTGGGYSHPYFWAPFVLVGAM